MRTLRSLFALLLALPLLCGALPAAAQTATVDLIRLGDAAAGRGEHAEALRLYGLAEGRDDIGSIERAVLHNNRGDVLRRTGDLAGALADFDRAIELDAGYVAAYDNRAWVARATGRNEDAVADLDRALALVPDDAGLLNNRGLAYLDAGDAVAAEEDFRAAIAAGGLEGDQARWPRLNLAEALLRQERGDEALEVMDRAIAKAPDDIDLRLRRGGVLARLGRYALAAREFTMVIERQPSHRTVHGLRGAMWERLGDWEAALGDYRIQREQGGESSWLDARSASLAAEVRRIQQALARRGYDVGGADGVPGLKTREAIRAFQKRAGLPVDGRLSAALLERIEAGP